MLIDLNAMRERGFHVDENEDGNIIIEAERNESYYRAVRGFIEGFDLDGAGEDFMANAIGEAHNMMQLRKFIR